MIIRKYGVSLLRLKQEDVELVREKRNSDVIRDKMFFQRTISAKAQQHWFEEQYNIYNYYFVIEYKGKKIGLINGKNVDYEARTAEGGLFIWHPDYWESFVPVLASVILTDYNFVLCNFEKVIAQVLDSNERTQHYNAQFGFKPDPALSTPDRPVYSLSREDYFNKGRIVAEAVMKITRDEEPLSWNDVFLEGVSKLEIAQLYTGLPEDIQTEIDRRIRSSAEP